MEEDKILHHYIKEEIQCETDGSYEDTNTGNENQLQDRYNYDIHQNIKCDVDTTENPSSLIENDNIRVKRLTECGAGSSSNVKREDSTPTDFKCPDCNKYYSTSTTLKRHTMTVHNSKSFVCNVCNKAFNTIWYLNEHKQKHQGIKNYKCEECSKCFTLKRELRRHEFTHGYKCKACGEKFDSKEQLNQHSKQHKDDSLYCQKCQKHFLSKEKFRQHIYYLHKNEAKYKCDDCHRCFTMMCLLKRHMIVSHGLKNFQCDVEKCGKRLKSLCSLNDHKKRHERIKKYKIKCEICCKYFSTKSVLKRHSVIHAMKFICDICGERFSSRRDLCGHIPVHTGMKKFGCADCSKCFDSRDTLKKHLLVTHGPRTFKCDVCEKTFKSKWYFDEHKQNHEGNFNFKCQLCSLSFKWKSKLKRHYFTHDKNIKLEEHGENIFPEGYMNRLLKINRDVSDQIDTHNESSFIGLSENSQNDCLVEKIQEETQYRNVKDQFQVFNDVCQNEFLSQNFAEGSKTTSKIRAKTITGIEDKSDAMSDGHTQEETATEMLPFVEVCIKEECPELSEKDLAQVENTELENKCLDKDECENILNTLEYQLKREISECNSDKS